MTSIILNLGRFGGAKRAMVVGTSLALLVFPGITWQANAWYMTDGTSVAHIDETSPSGMNLWTVDGVSELVQQSFWYRIGTSGGQTAMYTLPLRSITQDSVSRVTSEHANSQFDFKVSYALTGNPAGSGSSLIDETITLSNLKSTAYSFHLFQYVDLDLNATAGGDLAQVSTAGGWFTHATQQDGNVIVTETLGTAANLGQVGLNGQMLKALGNGNPLTLNGSTAPVGPGNAEYAFEWDILLPAKGSFTMTIQKSLQQTHTQPVPEPAVAGLIGLGLGVFALQRRAQRMTGYQLPASAKPQA